MGLDPKIAGLLFFIAMCWDSISDPIMAMLSERVNTSYGTYRPFLLFGSFSLALSFSLLFWPPPFQGPALIVTLTIVSIVFRTCYTIVAIPYAALTTRISYNSLERSDLSGSRVFFSFCGLLVVSYFLPRLVDFFTETTGSEKIAFQIAATIGGVLATLALVTCFFMTKEKPLPVNTQYSKKILANIKDNMSSNRALQILIVIIGLNAAAVTCLDTTLIFFIEANQAILAPKEIVLTAFALSTLGLVPLWTYMIRSIGRRRLWQIVTVLYVLTAFHMSIFSIIAVAGIPVQMMILGAIIGAYAIMIWAFIPDCVEFGQASGGGYRSESSVLGSVLIVQKFSSGLMGLFVGFMLSNFRTLENSVQTLQTNSAQITLFIAMCPAVLLTLSLIPIKALPMGQERHAEIMHNLNESGDTHG